MTVRLENARKPACRAVEELATGGGKCGNRRRRGGRSLAAVTSPGAKAERACANTRLGEVAVATRAARAYECVVSGNLEKGDTAWPWNAAC